MSRDLSRSLHALTMRLDRVADRMLRAEAGLSYSRFLALYMVGAFGADTQRALATRLGVSEPSVSRMAHLLEASGLLAIESEVGHGNRRRLRLTAEGVEVVERWGVLLEERLVGLVDASGVSYEQYVDSTKRLLQTLGAKEVDAYEGEMISASSVLATPSSPEI